MSLPSVGLRISSVLYAKVDGAHGDESPSEDLGKTPSSSLAVPGLGLGGL